MRDARPVGQRDDAVELIQAAADIARVAANAEGVSLGVYLDGLGVLLHIAGQTARVAREYEADALCGAHVRHGGSLAHHYNIGVTHALCNVLCDVETVACAGETEDHVFAHVYRSFVIYKISCLHCTPKAFVIQ